MHGFDYSVPHFSTRIRDTCIVVTPDIVSEVLHVPRVAHPNYPSCERLKTVSKDELMSLFYETSSSWGDSQNTQCSVFAKGLRFPSMVMTFVLHPLSHYYSITEPHARFLLSLLEHLTIDFPSHFILSLIDAYRDTVTHDKLIFPSAIMRILFHFSFSFPVSNHFSVMCAIDAAAVRRSKAQLRPKWPQTETTTPPASLTSSTSAPSSSAGGVTLDAIMTQFRHMDTCLETFSDELCQVNTNVSCIARRQARLSGFIESSTPFPETFEDEDDDGGFDGADEDDGASSSNDDEMTA